MKAKEIKVVLFDLDGTLVKADGSGRKALNQAIQKLHGFEDVCSTFSLAGRMDRENFELAFFNATRRKPTSEDLRVVETTYLRFLPQEVRKAVRHGRYTEMTGISRLLDALSRRKDVLLGLGTGNIRLGADIKLGPAGFMRYFTFGGFGGDGRSRAQMLRLAVRRAEKLSGRKVRSENVYVVGDTPKDVLAGKKAGYRTGAVTHGFGELNAIRKTRPDLLAQDFRDTRLWLAWIQGSGRNVRASGRR